MDTYKLVLPANLNHFGFLFGGDLLKWVDEYAWIAASLDFPGCSLVTVAIDKVEFRKSVREGTILRFNLKQTHKGRTSVQYEVTVFRGREKTGNEEIVFSNRVTLVNVDDNGKKKPLP